MKHHGLPDAGFTLVEVLVALSLFALAVTALLGAQTSSISALSSIDDRLYAEIVAENEMVRTVTQAVSPRLGFTQGEVEMAGRTFVWRRSIVAAGAVPNLFRVDIEIRLKGSEQLIYSLGGLRGGALE